MVLLEGHDRFYNAEVKNGELAVGNCIIAREWRNGIGMLIEGRDFFNFFSMTPRTCEALAKVPITTTFESASTAHQPMPAVSDLDSITSRFAAALEALRRSSTQLEATQDTGPKDYDIPGLIVSDHGRALTEQELTKQESVETAEPAKRLTRSSARHVAEKAVINSTKKRKRK